MFKWITAAEIDAWTERDPRRAQELLPKLVIKLILSLTNSIKDFNFPSGKSIQYAGYDGVLNCTEQTAFFPKGQSVWELGTDKDIRRKFNDDLKKRTENPLHIEKTSTVFVFVTSRIWKYKESIAEKVNQVKQNTTWKDIKIIDANSIEIWLEKCPSVSAWLADIIGKTIGHYTTIENYWLDKTKTTEPNLNQDFFLQGREDITNSIQEWFRSNDNHLVLRADTVMEALLVLSAIILNVDDTEHEQINSNCLIVEDEESWNNLISYVDENSILIPNFNLTPNIRYGINSRCILPINRYFPLSKNNTNIQCIDIPKQRKKDYEIAMEKLGIEIGEIYTYEYKTKRSFFALYRMITKIPARQIPKWSESTEVYELIPALLVGCWNEKQDGDIALIEALSACTYTEYENKLIKWLTIEDSPIIKIDYEYMIVSVSDMWNVLWDKITSITYQKLCECIPAVFKVKDPTFELPEEQWFAAGLYGKKHKYSAHLIEGLVITMIMLSERNDLSNIFGSNSTKRDIDNVIKRILDNVTDWQGWYTIADYLPMLIEASPDSVLLKLEEKAKSSDNDFWKLFNQPNDAAFGRNYHTHLLWALENLVWEQDYVIRAIDILVLYGEKRFEYKISNSPIRSLYQIFCLWHPQTCLSIEQKINKLEQIVSKYPHTGWELFEMLLAIHQQTVSNISTPRWKDVGTQINKSITRKEYWDAIQRIVGICIKYISPNVEQWSIIISSIDYFMIRIDEVYAKCIEHKKSISPEENMEICNKIGEVICRHREFSDAKWSMTEDNISRLEKLYYDSLPKGPIQYYHLFKYNPYDLNPIPYDSKKDSHREAANKLYERRKEVIAQIKNEYGMEYVYKIVQVAEDTRDLGRIIAVDVLNSKADWNTILKIKEINANVAQSIIITFYYDNGLDFIMDSLDKSHEGIIGYIMSCLPFEQDVWNQVDRLSAGVQRYYWENISVVCFRFENNSRTEYVVDKLLHYDRPYTLMDIIAYSKYDNTNNILVILEKALQLYPKTEKRGMSLNLVPSHDIMKLFDKLYQDESINEEIIAKLELSYITVFDLDYNLKCLSNQLIKNPKLFVELMMFAHRKDNDDGQEITEDMRVRATRSHNILNRFKTLPGYNKEKENIDRTVFSNWLIQVKSLSKKLGYVKAYEKRIGTLLSYSPIGKDGIWPHQFVREFIEDNYTELLAKRLADEKRNQRGVYTVTGGDEEKHLAELYREYADKLMLEYPKTASIVKEISDRYFEDSRYEQLREMKDY